VEDVRAAAPGEGRALLERARELAQALVGEEGPWQDDADRLLATTDAANLA